MVSGPDAAGHRRIGGRDARHVAGMHIADQQRFRVCRNRRGGPGSKMRSASARSVDAVHADVDHHRAGLM